MELTDCLEYRDLDAFLKDGEMHLNEAAWYEPPLLYGFKFAEPQVLPFRVYPGWFRFFPVHDQPPSRGMSGANPAGRSHQK